MLLEASGGDAEGAAHAERFRRPSLSLLARRQHNADLERGNGGGQGPFNLDWAVKNHHAGLPRLNQVQGGKDEHGVMQEDTDTPSSPAGEEDIVREKKFIRATGLNVSAFMLNEETADETPASPPLVAEETDRGDAAVGELGDLFTVEATPQPSAPSSPTCNTHRAAGAPSCTAQTEGAERGASHKRPTCKAKWARAGLGS